MLDNYHPMSPQLWKSRKYFRPDSTIDNWGDPYKMDGRLIYGLDILRKFVGRPIIIHCGYEQRDKGYHPKGQAVDCHIEGMHVFDQFLAAIRFSYFKGIGIYPNWNNPGLHLDTGKRRENPHYKTQWMCNESDSYLPLTWEYIKALK